MGKQTNDNDELDELQALPSGFVDRQVQNWRLLLAIAELAGGKWPERAHNAAKQLTRGNDEESLRLQLLKVFRRLFAKAKTGYVTSKEVLAELHADPTSPWV